MTPIIRICGRDDVPHHAHLPITDIVSIGGVEDLPNIGPFRDKNFTLHRFNFDDVNEDRIDAKAPSYEIIENMINIFKEMIKKECDILFHCMAGRNRSSAAAFIFLIVAGLSYDDAFDKIYIARGMTHPNLLMIKHADKILNKDGEMRNWVQKNFAFGSVDYMNYKFD